MIAPESKPRLRLGVLLSYDTVRSSHVMLFPEGVLMLNETAAAVVRRCEGALTVEEIIETLAQRYAEVCGQEVLDVLDRLAGRGMIEVGHCAD